MTNEIRSQRLPLRWCILEVIILVRQCIYNTISRSSVAVTPFLCWGPTLNVTWCNFERFSKLPHAAKESSNSSCNWSCVLLGLTLNPQLIQSVQLALRLQVVPSQCSRLVLNLK